MTSPVATVHYSPYDYAIHEDPYPTYHRLRTESPVFRNDEFDFYALSRYDDVLAAFRDPQRYSSSYGVTLDPVAFGPDAHKSMSFLAMDPPRHTRMRALVSRAFTPRRLAELEGRVRELTLLHLLPALEQRHFDFITDFAGKLPMDVISELIGVPEGDRAEVRRLADLLVHREEGVFDVPRAGMEAGIILAGYFADLLADRHRNPGSDLTSGLLQAEVDGAVLSDDEIISFLVLMVVAGNETTTKLLGNAWYWAFLNPDQKDKPWTEPSCIPAWVEETLRFDTSTQMLLRVAMDDIELHGTTVPRGSRVLLLVGSANRDEAVFPQAERYDLDRDTTKLLSFGNGRHFCMGASLARLEGRIALEELVTRVADYGIDVERVRRVHSVNVRGFASVPTTVELR